MRKLLIAAIALTVGACGACGGGSPLSQSNPAPAMVQVENAPGTEPHSGLQQADFVYEYLTEGGITRFTAIYFNPSGSQKVEPVRSARLVTLRLVQAYGGVLFFSGASSHVSGLINSEQIPNFNENATQYFARDASRAAPHNLYTTLDHLAQGVQSKGLQRGYSLPATGTPTGGKPVKSLSFQQTSAHSVSCSYASGSYTYEGETDAGAGGQPVKIANVILMQVAHHDAGYTEDVLGAQGIDYDLSGTGPATLYTGGQRFDAHWDLSSPTKPPRFLGSDGKQLPLAAGLTWVFLVDPGTSVSES
ncbi:MAG TPA: DUF3048 domain-containing protein [Candidatus Dormibacteraeota bacterium]